MGASGRCRPQPAPTPLLRLCRPLPGVSARHSRRSPGLFLSVHFCLNRELGSRTRTSPLAMGYLPSFLTLGFPGALRGPLHRRLCACLNSPGAGAPEGRRCGWQARSGARPRSKGPLPCGGAAPPIPGHRPPCFLCYATYPDSTSVTAALDSAPP